MTDINDIVEECATERFYVFRGHKGARAIELVYDQHRTVFNERTRAMSLVKAKLALRAYKALHGHGGPFWPSTKGERSHLCSLRRASWSCAPRWR